MIATADLNKKFLSVKFVTFLMHDLTQKIVLFLQVTQNHLLYFQFLARFLPKIVKHLDSHLVLLIGFRFVHKQNWETLI